MKKDFITPDEFRQIQKATSKTRYPKRNFLITLLLYRHGLRVSELCNLRVNDVDLRSAQISIRRLKDGLSNLHPLQADELRLLKAFLKDREDPSPYLFLSERGPFSRFGITNLCLELGELAGLRYKLHPHMFRHGCGYYLVNKGFDMRLIQDYLGHRSPSSTVRYTQVNSERFSGLFR